MHDNTLSAIITAALLVALFLILASMTYCNKTPNADMRECIESGGSWVSSRVSTRDSAGNVVRNMECHRPGFSRTFTK